ncbi:MAG TPA: glycerol-3-phosphate dehydrogenase/oxidase [Candidatus Limnocylindria bacterium]|nr:glycerol-3-phosphate dehydrogenase/oxidase [Candidatus Limnocylindria bacterium]
MDVWEGIETRGLDASGNAPGPAIADPEWRRDALRSLADERFDVLIVGGGIVGAGALLDATSRGLRAALVEQRDIASGTSGRSSRLIHGGLRYLEQLHFGLVYEALAERARLLRLAPHLVRIEPFLFPIYGIPLFHQAFYGSGIFLYDLLGARRDGGFAKHLRPSSAIEYAPDLRRKGLTGGIIYHDGVEDDARLALAVLRTALDGGAVAATRVKAKQPLLDGERLIGATVTDLVSGARFDVKAERVIDATGVWAAEPETRFAALEGADTFVPSRGSHIVIRRDRLPAQGGMTLRIPGRVVFIIPWPGHWIIGTTDHADRRRPEELSAPEDDVDELLETVNRQIQIDLTKGDIVGTYAGMRPLVGDPGGSTVKASREHRVAADASGLVRISGGKYTTYRVMARDVVDASLGRTEAKKRRSRTGDLPLVGAAPLDELDQIAASLERSLRDAAAAHGQARATWPPRVARRLADRYGREASDLMTLARDLDLAVPIGDGVDHLQAEVAWAARNELALSIDDVLARRMRLAQELPDRGASIAPRVAAILGAELGWDAPRQADEVASYLETARREYGLPWQAGR